MNKQRIILTKSLCSSARQRKKQQNSSVPRLHTIFKSLPAFAMSMQGYRIHWFYIKFVYRKVPGIASNILRNKSALVMEILITFTSFPKTCLSAHRLIPVLPNRKKLEIEANASAPGNPSWTRTLPKLVCCEAWWLRSNCYCYAFIDSWCSFSHPMFS